jgi:hypothetical protein
VGGRQAGSLPRNSTTISSEYLGPGTVPPGLSTRVALRATPGSRSVRAFTACLHHSRRSRGEIGQLWIPGGLKTLKLERLENNGNNFMRSLSPADRGPVKMTDQCRPSPEDERIQGSRLLSTHQVRSNYPMCQASCLVAVGKQSILAEIITRG